MRLVVVMVPILLRVLQMLKLYHVSNTQEFCVKKVGRVEVITMLGLFGMLMTVVELYPFLFKVGLKFLFRE